MAAFEARLVVGNAIRGEEIDEMNGLVTSLALVLLSDMKSPFPQGHKSAGIRITFDSISTSYQEFIQCFDLPVYPPYSNRDANVKCI